MNANKIRILIISVIILIGESCITSGDKYQTCLEISQDGHGLLKDGKPFFWMGDTGWFLFSLSPEKVDKYFQNRVANKFNVIQMMVTRRNFNSPDFTPNYKGDLPFDSLDPVKFNEQYFAHIDEIVEKAREYDLILVMAPTWGPVLDQIFSVQKPEIARDFGYMLGERYKDDPNVIWIVCGEYHKVAWDSEKGSEDPDEDELTLIDSLAAGLEAGHRGSNLMTIHPTGWRSSSENFHYSEWLDFNMVQSWRVGAGTEFDIINDYKWMPYKPTILAEPGYELGGAGNKAFEVRYEGYHSVLDGGCGFTYGCEGIWNFRDNWESLLDSEGTLQMKYMRRLFESRPLIQRIPAREMIKGCPGNWIKLTKPAAARSDDGSYAFIYFPADTMNIEVRVCEISGEKANAWWFNPRDGEMYDADGNRTDQPFLQFACNLHQTNIFNPPGNDGHRKDWILVLDDSEKMFKKP